MVCKSRFTFAFFGSFALLLLLADLAASQQVLKPGGILTLQPCGAPGYAPYQSWTFSSNGLLTLSAFPTNCLECDDAGYCNAGFNPVITDGCSASNYMDAWHLKDIAGSSAKQIIAGAGQCLQSMGAVEYALLQNMVCDLGYGNDIYQAFLVNPNGAHAIVSNVDPSLCVTADYIPKRDCTQTPYSGYAYCDQNLPTQQRVADLMARMNRYEKINNLANNNIGVPRLGVPPNKVLECLHGIRSGCGAKYNGSTGCPTSFPHALLLGATFNRSLWHSIGSAISDEGRALDNQGIGGLYCFSPDINLFRDPRWGRGQEVPGEDPFLTGQYGANYINGIQFGEDHRYLKMSNTVKHYADYDLEGGRYGVPIRGAFDAVVSAQDQVEYYWPAWRTVIQSAHAQSMMCSYPSINGVPACGNDYFMNEIARDEWGFDGFIISDEGAIADPSFSRYVERLNGGEDDVLRHCQYGVAGGCDANIGWVYTAYLNETLNQALLSMAQLEVALARWLTRTVDLGQLDGATPYYKRYGPAYVDSAANRALAQRAAEQGIVLLKNEETASAAVLLPLVRAAAHAGVGASVGAGPSYGFVGPHLNATQYMLSSYVGTNTLVDAHSPLQAALRQGYVDAATVQHAPGCSVGCTSDAGFAAALAVAKSVDIVVAFLGLYPLNFAQSNDNYNTALEAENFDRENVTFPGMQLALLQQLLAANPNLVLVVMNGSPLDLSWPKAHVPAIVESFYPGELGGDALMAVLFGAVSPAGKLPYTMYDVSLVNERAITDMALSSHSGITYRYYTGTPVYPFGFGLSYTTFSYKYFNSTANANANGNGNVHVDDNGDGAIVIETKFLADLYRNRNRNRNGGQSNRGAGVNNIDTNDGAPSFIVQVTNTGKRMDSDCVVLGFVTGDGIPDSPQLKLFDFQRTFVKMGESVNVTLSISPTAISLTNSAGVERIVPGTYQLLLGDYQNKNYVKAEVRLVGEEEVIFDLPAIKRRYRQRKRKEGVKTY